VFGAHGIMYGPCAISIFQTPLQGKSQLTDTDIITLVQEYKKSSADIYFKSSSPSIIASVKARADAEKASLLKLAR